MSAKTTRLQRRLEDKDFKLSALLGITQTINAAEHTSELLVRYREILCDSLGIGKLVLYNREDTWRCILQYGVEGEVDPVSDTALFEDEYMTLSVSGSTTEQAFDVVIPILQDDTPIAYLMVGDIDEESVGMSPVVKHMNFIQTITNILIVAVRNRRLQEENLRQERMRKELELAGEMQAMLVPSALPNTDAYSFAAHYRPHQQVGGDYYDVIPLNPDEVMLCIADVSGKGVSAAFLMANFQASLHSMFKYQRQELREVIRELNERVLKSAHGEKYITFFVAIYHAPSRKLRYVNCGHNPPMLMHPGGQAEELKLGSIGLGMFDEIPRIDEGEVSVPQDAFLLCYTDGLTEVENHAQEEFGTERVEQVLRAGASKSADTIVEEVLAALDDFKGDSPYVDDTAVLGCRFS